MGESKKDFANILSSMGVTNYDPIVLLALEEYSRRTAIDLLCDAKDYSTHAGKHDIDDSDIKVAIQLRNKRNLDVTAKLRKYHDEELNSKQLPEIKLDTGNVRYLKHPFPLTKRNFTYIPGIQAYPEVDGPNVISQSSTSTTASSSSRQVPTPTPRLTRNNSAKKLIPINISTTRFDDNTKPW